MSLLLDLRASFVAECGRRHGVEDFRFAASLPVGVRPAKIRVEYSADCCGVTFSGGLDEFVIGLKNGLIVGGDIGRAERYIGQDAAEQNAGGKCTVDEGAPYLLFCSLLERSYSPIHE